MFEDSVSTIFVGFFLFVSAIWYFRRDPESRKLTDWMEFWDSVPEIYNVKSDSISGSWSGAVLTQGESADVQLELQVSNSRANGTLTSENFGICNVTGVVAYPDVRLNILMENGVKLFFEGAHEESSNVLQGTWFQFPFDRSDSSGTWNLKK